MRISLNKRVSIEIKTQDNQFKNSKKTFNEYYKLLIKSYAQNY